MRLNQRLDRSAGCHECKDERVLQHHRCQHPTQGLGVSGLGFRDLGLKLRHPSLEPWRDAHLHKVSDAGGAHQGPTNGISRSDRLVTCLNYWICCRISPGTRRNRTVERPREKKEGVVNASLRCQRVRSGKFTKGGGFSSRNTRCKMNRYIDK